MGLGRRACAKSCSSCRPEWPSKSSRSLAAGTLWEAFHWVQGLGMSIVNTKKLETGLRTNSAGIPYALLLMVEAIGFPTFGLLL